MEVTRRINSVCGCPLTAAIAATGGKWKLLIISVLGESPRSFGELRRLMPAAISHKVLAEQLRDLAAEEIVERTETGPVPAPVVYSLSEHGQSLTPIVRAIRSWGCTHLERHGE